MQPAVEPVVAVTLIRCGVVVSRSASYPDASYPFETSTICKHNIASTIMCLPLYSDNVPENCLFTGCCTYINSFAIKLPLTAIPFFKKHLNEGTTTGSGAMKWPFFWDLNRLVGSLPLNDTALVDESLASNHTTPAIVEVGLVVSLRKVTAFLNNKSLQCKSCSQWQMHETVFENCPPSRVHRANRGAPLLWLLFRQAVVKQRTFVRV